MNGPSYFFGQKPTNSSNFLTIFGKKNEFVLLKQIEKMEIFLLKIFFAFPESGKRFSLRKC
jgi:hypothetical protein